jgi:hypothetical protein
MEKMNGARGNPGGGSHNGTPQLADLGISKILSLLMIVWVEQLADLGISKKQSSQCR